MKDVEKMNNDKKLTHSELIDKIYSTISPYFQYIFIERKDGVSEIQIFDEKELIKKKQNRFKIAYADMLVLDDKEKPLLVIEPETSASPKTFGRSITIYTIAQKVRVNYKNIEKKIEKTIESPLLLLIVIPKQPEKGQKKQQLPDLEEKLKKTIDLKGSSLKDFAICQDDVLKPTLKRLFINNGYDEYGCYFK